MSKSYRHGSRFDRGDKFDKNARRNSKNDRRRPDMQSGNVERRRQRINDRVFSTFDPEST